jgi:hypothetical protein
MKWGTEGHYAKQRKPHSERQVVNVLPHMQMLTSLPEEQECSSVVELLPSTFDPWFLKKKKINLEVE